MIGSATSATPWFPPSHFERILTSGHYVDQIRVWRASHALTSQTPIQSIEALVEENMADTNGTTQAATTEQPSTNKGKGKSAETAHGEDVAMGDDLSESDEESADEVEAAAEVEEEDDDNMEEIDTENIVGRRTRGKQIDYEEAERKAKQDGIDLDEDDEDEDDEDFEGEDDDDMKD